MTTATDQLVDIAKKGQEAVTSAVLTWADNAQTFATGLTAGQPKLPDAQEIVKNLFDFAEQILTTQRDFAQSLVAVGAKATEATTSVVKDGVVNDKARAPKN
jgi:hypothetical protein